MSYITFTVSAKANEAERHLSEVTCLLYHQDRVYSGADDGKVKVWSHDLKLIKEIDAHPVNVYSIAVAGDALYSCSNDGTIKAWSLDTFEPKKTLIETPDDEILRLTSNEGILYSGDDKGKVYVWENFEQVGKYEVNEEVWDLMVNDKYLFTVRNLDVSIIEMKPGGKQYTFVHSLSGRSPLVQVGAYFCFLDREGKTIKIHEISRENKFKETASIEAHTMIVNALCGVDQPRATIFSGGYDRVVKRWDVATQRCTGTAAVDSVVNALATGGPDTVYVAGAFGYITRLDAV